MARWVRALCRLTAVRTWVAGAVVAIVLLTTGAPAGAEVPPVPDAACANESSFKSTAGDHVASLLVINNTNETLQSLWLDYDGKRVHYVQIAPLTSYVQSTFLTHPWVIANLQGACYRLVVMNSPQQTVTVDPGDGPPQVTASPPGETSTVLASTTTTAPHNVTPPTASSVPPRTLTVTTKPKNNGPSVPLILAGAAGAVAAAAAAWWAAHNLAAKKAADEAAARAARQAEEDDEELGNREDPSLPDEFPDAPGDLEPDVPDDELPGLAPDDPGTGVA